jgi:hypothetical protein
LEDHQIHTPDSWEVEVDLCIAQVAGESGSLIRSQVSELGALAQRLGVMTDQPGCGLLIFSSGIHVTGK